MYISERCPPGQEADPPPDADGRATCKKCPITKYRTGLETPYPENQYYCQPCDGTAEAEEEGATKKEDCIPSNAVYN